MRLPSGARLDLLNPDPAAWTDDDLATRLARTYRWGGESTFDLPLSVAQHSLMVLELRRQWMPPLVDETAALLELTHDGDEAFTGFDCISPLKTFIGPGLRAVSERLMHAVQRRYLLRDWGAAEYRIHKAADITIAASEAVHCAGWSRQEVRDVLQIDADVLENDPLVRRYGGEPWRPWPSSVAAERFLEELHRLLAERARKAELAEAC